MRENNKIKIVEYNEPFNYSHAINLGAATAKGDLLLFLNNDIQVLNKDWLNELARWALIPEIGIVGGKLLYPNGRIQHAGVVLGLEGFVDHLYMNAPQDYCGLIGSVNWYRNISAVTGACQMMRRKVFDELGGYDENYRLIFSDVDICLKATQKNYRIVYTPFAQLTHYHGLSRERKDPTKDLALGFKRLTSSFDGNDPFFSPNLTYTYIPCCQIKPENGDDRMIRMRESQNIFQRWNDT
jgi:O-antigen biosynthesis protein